MLSFINFYLSEKSISLIEPEKDETPEDKVCILFGQKLADRFGLILNGWQEITFIFTTPQDTPDEKNTFTAKNEEEIVKKLKEKFPAYFDYIMKKNFPQGYKPDLNLPSVPPKECEPMDFEQLKAQLVAQKRK